MNGGTHSFFYRPETLFLGKFGPKNQNCLFKMKFGAYTNSNMQDSVVMLTFFDFDRKKLFWVNLVQKIEIVSLFRYLVPGLTQMSRIQWICSIVLLLSEFLFLSKFCPNYQNFPFKRKFGTQTNSNMQNSVEMFTFLDVDRNYLFRAYLFEKFKSLLPRLILICRIEWWDSLHLF